MFMATNGRADTMCMDISKTLGGLMADRNLSQYELARISGVPPPTIQRILSGETVDPKLGTVVNLSDALKVSVSTLVGDTQVGNVEPGTPSAGFFVPPSFADYHSSAHIK